MKALALLVVAAACGGAGAIDTPPFDGPTSPDAPTGCTLGLSYTPQAPIAGVDPKVRVVGSIVGAAPGAHVVRWVVLRNNVLQPTPPTVPGTNDTEIEIDVPTEALYTVAFSLEDDLSCLQASAVIDVNDPGTMTVAMRAHVVSPDPARPPLVKSVLVEGGDQDVLETIQLPPAIDVQGHLETTSGNPVAGYVRFMPAVGGEAAVETFANPMGDFQAKVRPETHDVLVIPTTPDVPPQIVTWTQQPVLALSPGVQVTGTVTGPGGGGLANATVQLTIDGVPSTLATTAGNGSFTLRAVPKANVLVRIEVTPAANAGLPRLVAESETYDPTLGITVTYAAGLATTKNLSGTVVQRGAPLANADVTIVGTIATAGTIATGATSLPATGEVRASATTNGSGVLPNLIVPSAQLAAVIFPGAIGDHAVTPVNLTGAVPATINAAPTVGRTTQLRDAGNAVLAGAVIDAVPLGDLALAGAPTIRATALVNGNATIDLAPNGLYQLRLSDPNGNRAALTKIDNVTTTSNNLTATSQLQKATLVQGLVEGQAAIPGAVVQFLCANCTGLERSRPVAEGVTGPDGRYSLAVPDPN